ncbi:MAG: threonine synthase [Proteobacteria bacterium]|nr:threonine synthase [Pseudomonadota bacterium]
MDIKYYSTNQKAPAVDFFSAILTGQAPDKGLYMPDKFPKITKEDFAKMRDLEYFELAALILSKYLKEIPPKDLLEMCKSAYTFYPRLENVTENKFLMRLDTGPTASFKDFAAQIMSRLMQFAIKKGEKLRVLTATSGDTGSAIAHAFHNIKNIDVVILFPINEVSNKQRKQMTTLGGNIKAVAIKGKFDDAQAMVKEAFADKELKGLNLTSANSINIARLLPQSVYYFWAHAKLTKNIDDKIIFSVPSGNFGDLMGGVLAWKMGLPVEKFIIATNANNEVPRFFSNGTYEKIEPSIECISNAMNVGHPSNFVRLIDAFGGKMDEKGNINKAPRLEEMRKFFYAISVNDALTKETINNVYKKYKVLLEPHGAVAWYGLEKYLKEYPDDNKKLYVSFETADPAKFPEKIHKILNIEPETPRSLVGLDKLKEKYETIDANYASLYRLLKDNF